MAEQCDLCEGTTERHEPGCIAAFGVAPVSPHGECPFCGSTEPGHEHVMYGAGSDPALATLRTERDDLRALLATAEVIADLERCAVARLRVAIGRRTAELFRERG